MSRVPLRRAAYHEFPKRRFTINESTHGRANVALDREERTIFRFLLEVARMHTPDTSLRVAGGWVRNKLLGLESDDIDIVLDNISGKKFASLLSKHQAECGMKKSGIGVMKANPEQSKHLECATMEVFGRPIDFVHLRREEYAPDSRIPKTRQGTLVEDAHRRDFTLNSLFYNIQDDKVEDCTGQGFADLQCGLLRTPLVPRETFLDDPLRVLRAIRFVSQFGFSLDEDLSTAARDKGIADSLRLKVSAERISIEVLKSLAAPGAVSAVALLREFHLMDAIIQLENRAWEESRWVKAEQRLQRVLRSSSSVSPNLCCEREALCFGVLLWTANDRKLPKPSVKRSLVETALDVRSVLIESSNYGLHRSRYALQEHLRLPRKFAGCVGKLIGACESWEVLDLTKAYASMENDPVARLKVALWLQMYKADWRSALVMMEVDAGKIEELRLEQFASLKPMIRGNEISQLLFGGRRGPFIGHSLYCQKAWQIINPDGGQTEALAFLVGAKKELRQLYGMHTWGNNIARSPW